MATFTDCATIVLLQQPFFATLLMKFKHVEDPTIPTLCVTDREIRYSPTFLASLTEKQGVFALCHEILHAVYEHLPRMRHYQRIKIGPDGQPYDQMLMNIACDFPINAALVASNVGELIPGCCYDAQRFPHDMMPEDVYCLLKQNPPPSQPQSGSGPSGQGGEGGDPSDGGESGDGRAPGNFDQHGWDVPGEGGAGTEPSPVIGPADVLEAVNVCKMSRGTLPAGIDRLIDEIRKPSVSPWRRLRQLVVSSMSGRDLSSWSRLQRKMIVRGVGMPGPVSAGSGTIGIVVDTSGSIDEDMLRLFGGHMAAIMDDAKPQQVHVYWTDAKMHRRDTLRNSTALRTLLSKPVPGGGGTDMPVGVRAAIDDKCDSVVVLTDGYTPFGQPSKRPVIWAITSNVKPPHGQHVAIN